MIIKILADDQVWCMMSLPNLKKEIWATNLHKMQDIVRNAVLVAYPDSANQYVIGERNGDEIKTLFAGAKEDLLQRKGEAGLSIYETQRKRELFRWSERKGKWRAISGEDEMPAMRGKRSGLGRGKPLL